MYQQMQDFNQIQNQQVLFQQQLMQMDPNYIYQQQQVN
jgi:hypothetical protein